MPLEERRERRPLSRLSLTKVVSHASHLVNLSFQFWNGNRDRRSFTLIRGEEVRMKRSVIHKRTETNYARTRKIAPEPHSHSGHFRLGKAPSLVTSPPSKPQIAITRLASRVPDHTASIPREKAFAISVHRTPACDQGCEIWMDGRYFRVTTWPAGGGGIYFLLLFEVVRRIVGQRSGRSHRRRRVLFKPQWLTAQTYNPGGVL
jgi:hypothetical protein